MKKIMLISIIILFSSIAYFAQPDWTPVIYTNSTTAYGLVTIDGSPAVTGDIVGAFVGTECRATGDVIVNSGNAYVTLLIQGEIVEEASFKIYDASEDKIYDVAYTINTSPGNTIGNPPDYLPLAATGAVIADSLEVSPLNREVTSESGTTTFVVESNINWNVTEELDWISVTPASGSNSDTLIVTYDANTSATERVGTITISGNELSKEVTVTQEGVQEECNPDWTPVIYTNSTTAYGLVTIDGEVASEGDMVGVFVHDECRAVGEVIINSGSAYVTLLIQGEVVDTASFRIFDKSECQELYLDYTIETNPGNTIGSPPDYLPLAYVSQIDSISVNPKIITVGPDSGSVEVNVNSNISWSVSENESWLSVTPNSGTNNGTFSVAYEANNSLSERVGHILVDTVEVTITQEGGVLPGIPILVLPENNIQLEDTVSSVEFKWTSAQFAESYTIEVSMLESFDSLVVGMDEIIDTSIIFSEVIVPGQYFWRVRAANNFGNGEWSVVFAITIYTDVEEGTDLSPQSFELFQNFPNPFNPSTVIKFGIPEISNVKIEVFNIIGQKVSQLVNSTMSSGFYEANWNASNFPSGIYFISMKAQGINSQSDFLQIKKALLIK